MIAPSLFAQRERFDSNRSFAAVTSLPQQGLRNSLLWSAGSSLTTIGVQVPFQRPYHDDRSVT
jgi:hypothetical protein